MPFAKPFTVTGTAVTAEPVIPLGADVTVYNVMGLPPVEGAVKVTVACAFPATAVGFAGVPGVVTGVTGAEASDAGPVPWTFVALTVKV